ncbi:hypothetical protein DPV78_005689 [Talaromyces pinophilus]|nr:hypothetical protein DPV78_005689 [Talaromyces pinophilus]
MQTQSSLHRLHNSRSRIWILVFAPILSLVLLYTWLRRPHSLLLEQFFVTDGSHNELPIAIGGENGNISDAKPESIPGMDDILVVLKTGVTESLTKVPIHLETTLASVPHFVVFSDYEEEISGIQTHDVLRRLDESVKRNIPEFELYNRIRDHGREALTPADYGDDSNGPFGRQNNPGWRLDKWKFLPMIPAALDHKPDAKWFVFMEADSYFLWPNLVTWLSQLDHEQDWYLGYPMQIGDTIFAYGGSGFVISNPVMRKMVQYLDEKPQTEINDYTATQWAGDCVLGKVFGDAGVGLNWSWPMLQDTKPWEVDYFAAVGDKRAWCFPVVSYHHMQPDDIQTLYAFDKEWFDSDNSTAKPLLYSDVFHHLILPNILSPRDGWDNAADNAITKEDGSPLELTFDDCSSKCVDDQSCLSYRYKEDEKSCFVTSAVKRGTAAVGVKSNWMIDRIRDKVNEYGQTCENVEFVL